MMQVMFLFPCSSGEPVGSQRSVLIDGDSGHRVLNHCSDGAIDHVYTNVHPGRLIFS